MPTLKITIKKDIYIHDSNREKEKKIFSMFSATKQNKGKRKNQTQLPQKLPRLIRSNLDDKPRKHIIWILNMRILLHYERIPTLIADHMKGFSFSDHVNFIASSVHELVPSDALTPKR